MDSRTNTLHGLFSEKAYLRPEHSCLKFAEHKGLTYREVADAVDRCAAHIVVLDADVIAMLAHRSYGLMVSLLGILRAGKAYCPIEPDFPPSRVGVMLEVADIKHVLMPFFQEITEDMMDVFVGGFERQDSGTEESGGRTTQVIYVRDDGSVMDRETGAPTPANASRIPVSVSDDSSAYVLFTSGSTGKPKGCMVPHRGSCLYAKAVMEKCGLNDGMVFMLKTPYVFDVHVQDIFTCFAAGGTLVIAEPGAHRDAGAMAETITKHGIHCCCFVPTLLVEFVNYITAHEDVARSVAKTLSHVLTIGEALMAATCREFFDVIPNLQIHNLYGPTEASVGVSHELSTKDTLTKGTVVPIGKPFSYVQFRIFQTSKYDGKDKIEAGDLVDVAEGEVGELFIGGDCLAKGYIKNPKKTGAAFFDFPDVCPRPPLAASPFSLYKTGDLARLRADGTFEYLGRNDFQVKIGGVRIECEEVSAVLKKHPLVNDALVTAFEGPYGKALAAYVIVSSDRLSELLLSPANQLDSELSPTSVEFELTEGKAEEMTDNVAKWGEVYDEMYKTVEAISDQDPTLNWSGYIDTYSQRPHVESVIKEWVDWSCEQVSRHQALFDGNTAKATKSLVTELGAGNGMLLFRLAPLLGTRDQGRYIGTDISSSALEYIDKIAKSFPQYQKLGIETAKIAAHEILDVCSKATNDVVLCNGVTMYFPSAEYLLQSMQICTSATKSSGYAVFGDIQSQRHMLPFRCDVEVFRALHRDDANAASVLRAAYKAVSNEELSYFDDTFFHRLDRVGCGLLDGRMARLEMRLKRGWWHSEFNRFRYDVEIVVNDAGQTNMKDLKFRHVSYAELQAQLQLSTPLGELMDPRLLTAFPDWATKQLIAMPNDIDGMVVVLPNARTLAPTRLMQWLQANAKNNTSLKELPINLHPSDALLGTPDNIRGVEPEVVFTMKLPEGWTPRVIWDEDPAMMRAIFLRESSSQSAWLGQVCQASLEALPDDLSVFRNFQEDLGVLVDDPQKAVNDAFKIWTSMSSLLPAMRPLVYVTLDAFPLNQAGKIDRGALPDAATVFQEVSEANTINFEEPATDQEREMAALWESVLKVKVGVTTPFVAYGGHSLTALQLCGKVYDAFQKRPDLLYLTSEDCTVRTLLAKMNSVDIGKAQDEGCVLRLSPADRRGMPLLIFGAAGASSSTYKVVSEKLERMQVYFVELPGHGRRQAEPLQSTFRGILDDVRPDVQKWVEEKIHFYVWGDSLGTVLAYTLACEWQRINKCSLLGFFVSGNAGPIQASKERGCGETVCASLKITHASCNDFERDDWVRFLLASCRGPEKLQEMRSLLAGAMGDSVIDTLRHDCLAYESYLVDNPMKLRASIFTMRGIEDQIAGTAELKSWKEVAGGKWEHRELKNSGHMLAIDAPAATANYISFASLNDLPEQMGGFNEFRGTYGMLRQILRGVPLKQAEMMKRAMRQSSPVLGAKMIPTNDLEMISLSLTPLKDSDVVAAQTPKVKEMRQGNLQWRLGESKGNRMAQLY